MKLLEVKAINRKIKPILPEITFDLAKGEVLALVGVNGAGKTTLLKSILGLIQAEGKIYIEGKDINEFSRAGIAQKIAYVPQAINTECFLVVDEYLDLSFYAKNKIDFKRKSEAINIFGIEKFLFQAFDSLSGGEKQKVLFAAAYCQDPKIYLLDEPFSALDIFSQKKLLKIIEEIKKSGVSIIVALHDLKFVSRHVERVLEVSSAEIFQVNQYLNYCENILCLS